NGDPNLRNKYGENSLLISLIKQDVEAVKILLAAGVDFTQPVKKNSQTGDIFCFTAVFDSYLASYTKNKEFVPEILELLLDIHIRKQVLINKSEASLLQTWCVLAYFFQDDQIIELLASFLNEQQKMH